MRTRRRQYGKGPWRQGQDTCVFQPVVDCKDEKTSYNDGYVSRIVSKDDRTVSVEKLLKDKFSHLIRDGWITAYVKSCQPKYKPSDRDRTKEFQDSYGRTKGACNKKIFADNRTAPTQINLISKKLGDTYDAKAKLTTKQKAFEEIRNAFSASIELLPDDGPWIIHTDLHKGNILFNEDTNQYSLHDWGRTLVIHNPKSDESFIKDCREFVNDIYPPHIWKKIPHVWQMPPSIVKVLQKVYDTGTVTEEEKHIIKTWTPFVILATVADTCRLRMEHKKVHKDMIEHSKTQAGMIHFLNDFISKKVGIDHYITFKSISSPKHHESPRETKRKRPLKPCKPGQVRNPLTNRCKKIPRSSRLSDSKTPVAPNPTKKPCPEGKIRNPATNRCVKADGKIGKQIKNES